jgi:hypothetical protein
MSTSRNPANDNGLFPDPISRKVDWRVLPLLGILSALSLIDRSNLGLARTAGMDHALVRCYSFLPDICKSSNVIPQGLSVGYRYSIVSSIFFVPYIIL